MQNYIKYLLESFGIALAGKVFLGRNIDIRELITITLMITSTLIILDKFAPEIGKSTRQGSGFGLGMKMVGGTTKQTEPVASNMGKNLGNPLIDDLSTVISRPSPTATVTSGSIVVDNNPQINILNRFKTDRSILTFYGNSRCDSAETKTITNKNRNVIEGFSGGASDNSATYDNYQAGPGVTASQQGLVYGKLMDLPSKGHLARIKETVYSGDLIDMKIKGGGLYLLDGSDFVRVSTDSGLDNKLLKLRLELVSGHKVNKLVPINYQDAVHIVFTDNESKPSNLSHNGELNSLKSTDRYTLFELVDADNKTSKRTVNFSDNILIKRVLEGTTNVYLKEDAGTKKISVGNDVQDASRFRIYPKKGCGPLWRFDSDTRTTNLFNSMQIRDVLEARTTSINNRMQQLREENAVLRGQRQVPSDKVIDVSDISQVEALNLEESQ
jgi:hypothetical protein